MHKILILITNAVFALWIFAGPSAVAEPSGEVTAAPEIRESDVFYGKADAKVVIVEYASLTCPHCANFHQSILPKLKAGPIADGRARLVFRDFPLDGLALRAAALSRCAGASRRLAILDLLFESQSVWSRSQNPLKPRQMEDGRWRVDNRWIVDRPEGAWDFLQSSALTYADDLVNRATAACLIWEGQAPRYEGGALVWPGNQAIFSPRRPLIPGSKVDPAQDSRAP